MSEKKEFDFEGMRLPQNFDEMAGAHKIITTIPVRKPNRQEFFRVRDGDEWVYPTYIVDDKSTRETYIVDRSIRDYIKDDLKAVTLYVGMTREGILILIPVTLPGPDGRIYRWHTSLLNAIANAKTQWTRIVSNMALGGWDCYTAEGKLPEPTYPDLSMRDILKIAFENRIIDSMEHPVVKRIKGAL